MDRTRYNEDDFGSFLQQLVGARMLEPMQEGIAKRCIDKGYDSLSVKQKDVLNFMIDDLCKEKCERCCTDIPWCEMFEALDNGGYCNYCQHMLEKIDD